MAPQVLPVRKTAIIMDLTSNSEFHADDGTAFADLIIDGHRERGRAQCPLPLLAQAEAL
jgi:hypothetical protein